ncbi:3-oxoacyl-[acyl-carrier protein] reductase [Halopseudomonas xinjiangensis]|uniref:3-oxoacyl-[acyl-carrier protein] reductase n=2 Tax=Halopseudomonas xinjiangensis TaxID=487184 RepID=A0A1H1QPW4_9GAMM|nr:3-oxoacyl-[acyl-carrier protein] reductase [Halopseudomonas xinjiangensis]
MATGGLSMPASLINLRDRVALVTGAGSAEGIGFATAKLLFEAGACVALTSTTNRIFERQKSLDPEGERSIALVADLTHPEQAQELVDKIIERFGRIDVLVNNAGMTQSGAEEFESKLFHHMPFEHWQREIDLNLNTCVHVTQAVLPHMLKTGYGRIVNVASVTGPLVTFPGTAGYSAAKSAMVGLTRSIAHEVAGQGITVNAVAPGWIATHSSLPDELQAGRRTPVGRPGTPEEVARVALFLASPGCSYVTGQMLVVDGGNSLQEMKG